MRGQFDFKVIIWIRNGMQRSDSFPSKKQRPQPIEDSYTPRGTEKQSEACINVYCRVRPAIGSQEDANEGNW